MIVKEAESLKIRLPTMSVSWWATTVMTVFFMAFVAVGFPWVAVPFKVAMLVGVVLIWIRVAVVRPARVESREGTLVLNPGTLSKSRSVEWRHVDSILLWKLNFQGSRGMIGVRLKKGVPRNVRFPEGTPGRYKGYPEGWPASRDVTDTVRAYSIAMGWVRPESVVELVKSAAPRVKVIDIRNPRNPVELWPEENGTSLAERLCGTPWVSCSACVKQGLCQVGSG